MNFSWHQISRGIEIKISNLLCNSSKYYGISEFQPFIRHANLSSISIEQALKINNQIQTRSFSSSFVLKLKIIHRTRDTKRSKRVIEMKNTKSIKGIKEKNDLKSRAKGRFSKRYSKPWDIKPVFKDQANFKEFKEFKDAQNPHYEDIYDEIYDVNYGRGKKERWSYGGRSSKTQTQIKFGDKELQPENKFLKAQATQNNQNNRKFSLRYQGQSNSEYKLKNSNKSNSSNKSFNKKSDLQSISLDNKEDLKKKTKKIIENNKLDLKNENKDKKKIKKKSSDIDKQIAKKSQNATENKKKFIDQDLLDEEENELPEIIVKKLLFSASIHHFDRVQQYFHTLRSMLGEEILMKREDIANAIVVSLIECHRISEAEQWVQWLYKLKDSNQGYFQPQSSIVLKTFFNHFSRMGKLSEAEKYLDLLLENHPEERNNIENLNRFLKLLVKDVKDIDRAIQFYRINYTFIHPTSETFEILLSSNPNIQVLEYILQQMSDHGVKSSEKILSQLEYILSQNISEENESVERIKNRIEDWKSSNKQIETL